MLGPTQAEINIGSLAAAIFLEPKTMTALQEKIKQIRDWFKTIDVENPSHQKALERAVLIVWRNQTSDEQADRFTKHDNGTGFTGRDASFGSAMAERALAIANGTSQYPALTPNMYKSLARMMPRYARQLAEYSLRGSTDTLVATGARETSQTAD